MIRIAYVEGGRKKTVTIEGSTTADAVAWMARNVPGNVPGNHIFRASVMRKRRTRTLTTWTCRPGPMVAADETGTGAHYPVRRR